MSRARIALRLAVLAWALYIIGCLFTMFVPETAPEPVPVPETEPTTVTEQRPVQTVQELMEEVRPKYYEVPLNHEMQDLLRAACEESGIDMELALAVIWKETDFRNMEGDGGESFGYMQVQPKWHQERMERLGVTDLMDPASNFRVGCDFLAELLDKYALAYALTYYNSGEAVVSQYSEEIMDYMEVIQDALLQIGRPDCRF